MEYVFATHEAAQAELTANGWTPRDNVDGVYWVKPSKVDDWYGGYPVTAIVHIERRVVAPEYGGRDYFELRFV